MTDKSDNWDGEYPREHHPPEDVSTEWSQNIKLLMLNKYEIKVHQTELDI